EHGALVDLPNAAGHTPLLVVSGVEWSSEPTRGRYKTEEASIETLRVLLDAGADINAITGDPALRRPAGWKPGGDAGPAMGYELRRNEGQTALHGAAKQGWTQIAQFLIENGAIQEVVDGTGKTPFDLAMGRYQSGSLQPPPQPQLETAKMLQEACLAQDGCTIREPVDFSNPEATAIQ